MLYTSEILRIVGNNIVEYADDTTIFAVIRRPILRFQVIESLNQELAAVYFWCLKWHMRLNFKKTKSKVNSRFPIYAPGYYDLTLVSAELEQLRSLHIFG